MAEEEKPKQLVQMSTVFASGIAAIIAALFTSRLGVTGTLIGTALTPMLMTVGVAVLNAQIQKATEKISDLPSTVRGRISTQRVRVPGTPSQEDPPEEPEQPAPARRRDRRTPGFWERLRSVPIFLKSMSPSARRRTLLTGVAAGLVAAAIGLAGVTGIEAASGNTLSCGLYEKCAPAGSSGGETAEAGTSLTRFLGGSGGTDTEAPAAGDENQSPGVQQQEAQPAAPDPSADPQSEQYEAIPQDGVQQETPPAESQEGLPQDPAQGQEQPATEDGSEALPQDGVPEQQPSADPGAEQQAVPSE